MASRLQGFLFCFVTLSQQGRASECQTKVAEWINGASAKCKNVQDTTTCDPACLELVKAYRTACKNQLVSYAVNGHPLEQPYDDFPNDLVAVTQAQYPEECQIAMFDEAYGHITKCQHAVSIMFWTNSKPVEQGGYVGFYPFCRTDASGKSQTACAPRCQKAMDAVHNNCKAGDEYIYDSAKFTVVESKIPTFLQDLGPPSCNSAPPPKGLISTALGGAVNKYWFLLSAILIKVD
mmetsp:Transcript_7862/g.14722  ORF Transcript_7862/g.14722 Transcript_7862/m.14722 type:complete len:235 (-) Transcript_7862:58-762(-)